MNPLATRKVGTKAKRTKRASSHLLNGQLLTLLLRKLGQLFEDLAEVLIILINLLALAGRLGGHHDHTSRAFGGGRGTELSARGNENVGNSVVLAQNGNVRDDIHGGDISSENDDGGGDIDGSVGSGNSGLAESLDNFLDTTLERLVDGSYKVGIKSVTGSIGQEIHVDKVCVQFAPASQSIAKKVCNNAQGKSKKYIETSISNRMQKMIA